MAFYECKGPAVQRTLLWENPSSSSNLDGGNQSLSDNLSSYKYLEVWYSASKTDYNELYVTCLMQDFIDNTESGEPRLAVGTVVGGTTFCRILIAMGDSTINFHDCKALGSTTVNNANIIITRIYGVNS